MNLVEEWAQELGLSEGFFSSWTRPYGSGMAECVEKGWKFILGLGPRINSSSWFFGISRWELFKSPKNYDRLSFLLSSFFFFYPPPPLWDLSCYISFSSVHPSRSSCKSLLECLSHLVPFSTCCELQQTMWYCSGVIPSLMRSDCQLQAFNAKVTASPIIAPPL